MPALQAEQISDMLITTQKKLGRFRFQDAAQQLQRFPAFTQLMRKNRTQQYGDGIGINWQVGVSAGAEARMAGFYAKDIVNQGDNLKTATLGWKRVTHNYAYDEAELSMNMGESRILDIMKHRKFYAWLKVAEKVEYQLWRNPSSNDDINGIPYHVVKNATTGFNGGHAPGQSDWCGLSRNEFPTLKNYTADLDEISKDDCIDKISDALDLTNFVAPVDYPAYSTARDYGMYTTRVNRRKLKRLAETQNDNLGIDLDPYNDRITIRRIPIEWVPLLDNDTDAPLYGINWSVMHAAVLTSWFMREKGPKEVNLQHTVFVFFIDLIMNTENWEPRANFVLSFGTTGGV